LFGKDGEMPEFWIRVTTCDGDGERDEIAVDLKNGIRQAADYRSWTVVIGESLDEVTEAAPREPSDGEDRDWRTVA
jgi:hypothetical protein